MASKLHISASFQCLFLTQMYDFDLRNSAFSQNITSLSVLIIFPTMALIVCPSFLSPFYKIAILEHYGYVQSKQLEHI